MVRIRLVWISRYPGTGLGWWFRVILVALIYSFQDDNCLYDLASYKKIHCHESSQSHQDTEHVLSQLLIPHDE